MTLSELKAVWRKIKNRVRGPYVGMSETEQAAALADMHGLTRAREKAAALIDPTDGPNTYWRRVLSILESASE